MAISVSIATRIASYFENYVMTQVDINGMAKTALLEAGSFFLDNMLKTRFTYDAHRTHGFRKRSAKWNAWKFRGRIPPDGFFNTQLSKYGLGELRGAYTEIVPHPKGEPRPFDARGQLKDFTLGRVDFLRKGMQVKGAAGDFADMMLRIKMPYPHPLRTEYADEMTTLNQYEQRRLGQVIHMSIRRQIKEAGFAKAAGARIGPGGYPIINAA